MNDSGSEQKDQSLGGRVSELLDMISTYTREQTELIIETKVSAPIKSAAKIFFSSILAAGILGLAAIFLAVAVFLLLLEFIPAWIALGVVGLVLAGAGAAVIILGRR